MTREVVGVLQHQVVELAQDRRALLGQHGAPGGLRAVRGLDRAAGFGGAHGRNLADRLAGGGVLHHDGLAAVGLHPFAVDVVGLTEQRRVLQTAGARSGSAWRCPPLLASAGQHRTRMGRCQGVGRLSGVSFRCGLDGNSQHSRWACALRDQPINKGRQDGGLIGIEGDKRDVSGSGYRNRRKRRQQQSGGEICLKNR